MKYLLTNQKISIGVPSSAILLIISGLFIHLEASESTNDELLPNIQPVKKTLMDYDLVKDPNTGQILLRFSNGIGNYDEGTLEIVGIRESVDPNDNFLPAYQRIYKTDGTFEQIAVGKLEYHPEHHHYHYTHAVSYSLIDKTNRAVISSTKASFCLADSDIVDNTLQHFSQVPRYNRCYSDPQALFVKMGISPGWEDVYDKNQIGQAFDVTDLMQKNSRCTF